MPVSRPLQRLLRIREIEEEQCRLALESAAGELHRLEAALAVSNERERKARRLVGAALENGDVTDRVAGKVEGNAARNASAVLRPGIAATESQVAERRGALMQKKVERRQAETLIDERIAVAAVEEIRHEQRGLDDWFRSRRVSDGGKQAEMTAGSEEHKRSEPGETRSPVNGTETA